MRNLFILPLLFTLPCMAQHHGRDSVNHQIFIKVFRDSAKAVRTVNTYDTTIEYVDTLRAPLGTTTQYDLYMVATAPNGHTGHEMRTLRIANPDGHCVLAPNQRSFAKSWRDEQLYGSHWDIKMTWGLILVTVRGVKSLNIKWRYVKVKQ